ncbi:ATP-binding protein [Oscillatoria sp. FACHB-1406]|uniref:ATP-binding protein n=1 Tax=Oscillatoria sp. FACHB-1406 TaxID=2692846 RepID=UPI0016877C72|nr:ATP-binding protein [Oscillatoria sp. FACHB-1406]MBD2579304.1 GAF domain-containing protein [Oscillatoria sp. FACHB-1406]
MSKRQLQSATTFNVLIVAKADREAALVAETLHALPMPISTHIAPSAAACDSLLAQNQYDAIIASEGGESDEITLAQILSLLQQSGRTLPLIWIANSADSVKENLRDRVADCILRDRLFILPEVLQHRLLPPNPMLGARRVQALQKISAPDEFIQEAAQILCETLALDFCSILQPEADLPRRARSAVRQLAPSESLSALEAEVARNYDAIVRYGSPVILRSLSPFLTGSLEENGKGDRGGKMLLVPLKSRQSNLGVAILCHQSEQHQWTEAELDWMATVAADCILALEWEQCNQQLQKQQECQDLLHRVGMALNSTSEVEVRFQDAIARIGEHFAVDRVLLMRINETDIWVEREWRAREKIPSALYARIPCAEWPELSTRDRDGIFSRSFQTADLVEFCREREESHRVVAQSQAHSMLSIPIFVRDLLFGWLLLQTTRASTEEGNTPPRTFTPEEVSLLESLALQIALAAAALEEEDRLQQEVEQRTHAIESANRAKSEFLSTMSHELRAPLTSVIGFARVLLERIYGELNTKQVQYITAIADSGEHLLSLIEDLLDISKIEANKEELYIETLSVEEVCRSSISLLQERAQQAGLQLGLELHPSVTVCCADRRRLKQILVNLLSNAIKFTPAGSVTLKVRPEVSWLNFSVIDTGIGIEPADLQNLFQPFQQIQTPLHRKHKGSGLGLALSRKLARLHGGDLVGTSVAGQGSCFTLSLPLAHELPSPT